MEDIFILAQKVTFIFNNTFNEYKHLVGFLKFETVNISNNGFEVVFANQHDQVVCILSATEDENWHMNVHITQKDTKMNPMALKPTILAIQEHLVYKVHKSTLQFVTAKGSSLAILVAKDLIRYYKLLHMSYPENYYISDPQYIVNDQQQELFLGAGAHPCLVDYVVPHCKQHVVWLYRGKKIRLEDARYIAGYPCTRYKYFIAIYKDIEGPYRAPHNVVVYNADGSIHLRPSIPEALLVVRYQREEMLWKNASSFFHVNWETDFKGNLVVVMYIALGESRIEKLIFHPETGRFSPFGNIGLMEQVQEDCVSKPSLCSPCTQRATT